MIARQPGLFTIVMPHPDGRHYTAHGTIAPWVTQGLRVNDHQAWRALIRWCETAKQHAADHSHQEEP